MLTSVVVIGCVIAFFWGANEMSKKSFAGSAEFCAVTFAPMVALGFLFAAYWQAALALLFLMTIGVAVACTFSALFSGACAGQMGKVLLVVGACVIALPPFWPIAIPLALCLVGVNLLLAPIFLLFGSVGNLFGGGR